MTSAYPTTSNISEVYASADQVAITTLLANKAVERSITSKLEDAREAVSNKVIDILTTYKNTMTSSGGGASAQLSLCENLKFLPLLTLGILKHVSKELAQLSLALTRGIGWNSAKLSDPFRPEGVRADPPYDTTLSDAHPLSPPYVLLAS